MRLSGVLLVWLAALWPQAGLSAPAPTAEEAGVRTGTTEVHDANATEVVESRREAPSDAPRSHGGTLRLPGIPVYCTMST